MCFFLKMDFFRVNDVFIDGIIYIEQKGMKYKQLLVIIMHQKKF